MTADPAKRLQAAVEAGTVTADTARAILNWIHPDGRIEPPTERAAAVARDVLEAAGLEFRLVEGSNPSATPRETDLTPPETEARDADRRATAPVSASSRGSLTPQKRRKGRKRTQPPNQPRAPRADAQAAQAAPSKPPLKSAAARSRAAATWAAKEPAAAARFLLSHPAAVLDLLAPDANEAHGEELHALYDDLHHVENLVAATAGRGAVVERLRAAIGVGERQLLDLVAQLPSAVEVAGEPLSVLAAARETLGRDVRETAMMPHAPQVRVIEAPEDRRLPAVLPDPEPQLVLPTMQAAADRSRIGPAPWLTLFDRMGGNSMERGRGAPLRLRAMIEVLAAAPPAARRGRLVQVPMTVRELRDAFWPDGWQRGKQLPRLIHALQEINGLGFLTAPNGRTQWAPVLWRQIPTMTACLDDLAIAEVRLPVVAGAGDGARFDRPTLRRLGLRSAPEYRAYLGLIALWDAHLVRGSKPWTPANGVPVPWPALDPADRRRLIFGPDAPNRSTTRTRQLDADRAFDALVAGGVIDLRPDDRDPRIVRPIRRDLK